MICITHCTHCCFFMLCSYISRHAETLHMRKRQEEKVTVQQGKSVDKSFVAKLSRIKMQWRASIFGCQKYQLHPNKTLLDLINLKQISSTQALSGKVRLHQNRSVLHAAIIITANAIKKPKERSALEILMSGNAFVALSGASQKTHHLAATQGCEKQGSRIYRAASFKTITSQTHYRLNKPNNNNNSVSLEIN